MSAPRTRVRAALKVASVGIQESCEISSDPDALGIECTVARSSEISNDILHGIYDLWANNMQTLYTNSSFGWKPAEKEKELFASPSRFILAFKTGTGERGSIRELVGFTMFRFEYEDGESLVYCYEIQISPGIQGIGLGRKLMGYLETIGNVYEMDKIMLTVLKANQKAFQFYEKYGFQIDPSSPSLHGEEVDYEIMSKEICTEWSSE
ncbi:acyl-CoA N-acyltransferase [Coprinopsis sp. MPI-PUGE-AT-0042]|nr:acyl-CoA N-acyltransferase [Coprinopsis sp. MPI-PUGE-AT-0042]